jgi:hypothetical protein
MRMRWPLLSLSLLVAGNSWAQQANAAIEGQVVNSVTNAPVRKASVYLYYREKLASSLTLPVEADLSGRFEFKGLQPGSYEIDAGAPGYYGSVAIGLPFKSAAFFTLSAGQTLTDITLRLTPGSTVSGRIADEDDEPLAGLLATCSPCLTDPAERNLRRQAMPTRMIAAAIAFPVSRPVCTI